MWVEILLSVLILADNFQNIIERFHGISLVAHYADYIFWIKIPCHYVFYIKEMKLDLLRL